MLEALLTSLLNKFVLLLSCDFFYYLKKLRLIGGILPFCRYLGEFIEGVQKDQLNVGIWKGLLSVSFFDFVLLLWNG